MLLSELLSGGKQPANEPLQLTVDRATAACNSIAYLPAHQVAAVAAPTLETLRQQYLAGASAREMFALVVS